MSGETVWFSRRKKQGQTKSNQYKIHEAINKTFDVIFKNKEEVKENDKDRETTIEKD